MTELVRFAGASLAGLALGLLLVVWSTGAAVVLATVTAARRLVEPAFSR